jgi:hypothetical protein
MRERRPLAIAAFAIALLVCAAAALTAQAGIGQLEDASIAPRRLFRLRTASVWTRYDQRFTATGFAALGAPFTADSLGAAQLPALGTAQSLVRTAAGSPFTLSLGQSHFSAIAREEHVPFMLEYGLTRHLALAVVVPWIRKRVSGLLALDSLGANMGPNPRRRNTTASQTNGLVQTEFASAASLLQNRLSSCTASPAGAGCPALLSRQTEAQQLIQSSQAYAATVGSLYGTATGTGEAFVPRTQSTAQAAIAARVADFNAKYKDLLASPANFLTAIPVGAAGAAGSADIEDFVTGDLGRDSIAPQQLFGIGDVEVGFKYLAIDHAIHGDNGAIRLALASSVRLPTGTRQSPVGVADLRIGDGGIGFDARAILEVRRGWLGLIGASTITLVGSGPESAAGDTRRIAIDLAPEWHVSAPLAIHGAYSLRNADVTGSTLLVGGGVSFTTVNSYRAGSRPLPMEMRYTHLETARGDAGAPKFTRDQLEVRIYYQPGGH